MNKTILIGNGINNINNNSSWSHLLKKISNIEGVKINLSKEKPFPLLYEEIYLKLSQKINKDEEDLKSEIARFVSKIETNDIHEELLNLNIKNYLTTNYDYCLQKVLIKDQPLEILNNNGIVKETKYNIFRHHLLGEKRFWHIHGEINVPNSITLGFEHYGGQLQQYRNYVVTGTSYNNKKLSNQLPLQKRLKENLLINDESWLDFFFKDEVHIIGLNLSYQETDLWWLLTNRARFILSSKGLPKYKSEIIYYCPEIYRDPNKTELLEANQIKCIYINLEKEKYYKEVIKRIHNGN